MMLPEEMTNRPGDVRMKKHAIKMLKNQILAIRKSMKEPDMNGKLPGEYKDVSCICEIVGMKICLKCLNEMRPKT